LESLSVISPQLNSGCPVLSEQARMLRARVTGSSNRPSQAVPCCCRLRLNCILKQKRELLFPKHQVTIRLSKCRRNTS